eukprot:7174364-Prymnesium_polylepis.1
MPCRTQDTDSPDRDWRGGGLDTQLGRAPQSCLGFYKLCAGIRKNNKPVWRHTVHPDRFLAFSGSAWIVQSEAKL